MFVDLDDRYSSSDFPTSTCSVHVNEHPVKFSANLLSDDDNDDHQSLFLMSTEVIDV